MGAGEVNKALDSVCLPNVENYRKSHYPHHSLPGSEDMTKRSWVYDVMTAEPALRRLMNAMDVEILAEKPGGGCGERREPCHPDQACG